MRRIEGEELALDAAELVITSTRQEIDEQWGLYDGFDVKLEKVLRARTRRGVSCHGRFMPRMVVSVQWQVYMFFSSVTAPYNFWQNSTKLIFEVAYVWGKQRVFRLYH
jgi:hypothetical protein